jgi:hypothetical protein
MRIRGACSVTETDCPHSSTRNEASSGKASTQLEESKCDILPSSQAHNQYEIESTRKPNEEEKKRVHEQLVKGCIYGNVPWASFFSNPYFRDAFALLRPGFELTSRQDAATTIVDQIYHTTKIKTEREIGKSKVITIICDSITDCNRKNITNWIIADDTRKTYLMDLESGLASKTAEEVYESIVAKIEEFKIGSNCIVNHTSDSASVYFKARQLMKRTPSSPITLTCGCMAHMTNLFLKDFINSVPFVSESIQFVVDIAVIVSRLTVFSAAALEELKTLKLVKQAVETFALDIPTKTR